MKSKRTQLQLEVVCGKLTCKPPQEGVVQGMQKLGTEKEGGCLFGSTEFLRRDEI